MSDSKRQKVEHQDLSHEEKWHSRVQGVWHSTHTIFDSKGDVVGNADVGRKVDKKTSNKLQTKDGEHLLSIDMSWDLNKAHSLDVPYMSFSVLHMEGHRTYIGPDFHGEGLPLDGCLIGNDYCRPWQTHNKVIVHVWPDGKHQTYTSVLYRGWTIDSVINSCMLWTPKDYQGNHEIENSIDKWCDTQKKEGKRVHKYPQHLAGYYSGTLEVWDTHQNKLGKTEVIMSYVPEGPTKGQVELVMTDAMNYHLKYLKSRNGNEHFYEGPDVYGTAVGYGRLLLSTQTLHRTPRRLVGYEFMLDDEYNMSVVWEFHKGLSCERVCHGFLKWNYGAPPTSIPKAISEAPIKFRRAFFDTPHGQMHYKIGGQGNQWIFCFHQSPRSSDEFTELLPLLGKTHRVVTPDTLGYGDSDQPPRKLTIAEIASHMIGLMDHLGVKSAALMGQHTGSFIAIEIAASHPERVDYCIYCSPAQFMEEGAAKVNSMPEPIPDDDGSYLMKRWKAHEGWMDTTLNHRWVLDEVKSMPHMRRAMYSVADFALIAWERMIKVNTPGVVIWGAKDIEQFHNYGFQKAENRFRSKQAMPQVKWFEVPNGTIAMLNQMPEAVYEQVTTFEKELKEGIYKGRQVSSVTQ